MAARRSGSGAPARHFVLATLTDASVHDSSAAPRIRARDLGIPFEGDPGSLNAITDVPGVEVGHVTLIRGEPGPVVEGGGPIRTGVTAILPRGRRFDPVFAATYALNGNGEMTGTHWIEESGFLEAPILITNTFSVGARPRAAARPAPGGAAQVWSPGRSRLISRTRPLSGDPPKFFDETRRSRFT